MKRILASVWEIAELVFIAFVAVFIIRNFLVQPFLVSGASMAPTYAHGDYLLIDELTYRVRPPTRGEVIVFRYPKDESLFFIKRIIGLPGERVVLRGGELFLERDGELAALEEDYIPAGNRTPGSFDITLGAEEYLVLGDNRGNSFDSRTWGPVTRGEIVGIARLRLYPFDKVGVSGAPLYEF